MTPEESTSARSLAVLGLNATGVAGLRERRRLEAAFGPLEAIDASKLREEADESGRSLRLPKAIREMILEGGFTRRGDEERARAQACGLRWTLHDEASFPERLARLANPPLVIYRRGEWPEERSPTVGVVGSRRCSRYALRVAEETSRELAERGVVVVSGLARGVDAAAHRGSLVGSRHGIAILGCGLSRVYPPEHAELASQIASRGAVLSEFGPDVAPLARNFPRRNRLIAGLSDALLVVEAQLKSGALITARWAADLGKDVFVIPNQVDNPSAAGSLLLLRDGARPVRHARDLIDDLGWVERLERVSEDGPAQDPENSLKVTPSGLEAADRRLLDWLDHEPTPVDQILSGLGMSAGEVLTRLMALELRGLVEQLPGLTFRKVNERGDIPSGGE